MRAEQASDTDRSIRPPYQTSDEPNADAANEAAGLRMLAVTSIVANEYQPRRTFDDAALESLAASIREAGMMQPVVVRPRKTHPESGRGPAGYELIAGERRWRAAQSVGLTRIPAVVREVDDQTAAQWALVENLQREDLNAVERARAFQRLAEEFALTHQEIADRVGLDRTSVTNHLRLLDLGEQALELVASGKLSMGHGRALLAITNLLRRGDLARQAAAGGWSVRELERRARAESRATSPASRPVPAHIEDLQRRLGEHLGAKVQIHAGAQKGTGKIAIEFFSLDEFEGLLSRLGFDPG